jgi:hypothetical protein
VRSAGNQYFPQAAGRWSDHHMHLPVVEQILNDFRKLRVDKWLAAGK